MYKREAQGWLKHWDFLLLDLICLQIAYWLSYFAWIRSDYDMPLYISMAIFIELADVVVIIIFSMLRDVLKRGHYKEFVSTLQQTLILAAIAVMYLFMQQQGDRFSRGVLITTFVFSLFINYGVREWRKHNLKKKWAEGGNRSLLIAVSSRYAEKEIQTFLNNNYQACHITGIALLDKSIVGESIAGVPVVADIHTAPAYVCQEWIDEVMIFPDEENEYMETFMSQIEETGVTMHIHLANVVEVPGKKQFVEKFGGHTVLTTSMNFASPRELLIKRCMDIVLGIAGCIATGIIFIFVAPMIYIASPGPIFFAQERIGKNGRRFKMYKFRSMYLDAEERKADLMKENKVSDGKMFKMDFDPRVIGNKVLPDGTRKTGVGDFIRRTSLDEFPQFFNVLKGDMSVIGTRPPLPSETSLYELHHRARLSIKPGITGLWQVSGRSDITDFEEVLRLDKEYINNWSIGMDLRILFKTAAVVLKKDGSM